MCVRVCVLCVRWLHVKTLIVDNLTGFVFISFWFRASYLSF